MDKLNKLDEFKDDKLLEAARLIVDHCCSLKSCEGCIFYKPFDDGYFVSNACILSHGEPTEWEV